MIRNTNPSYGEAITFQDTEEMEQAIRKCGYEPPTDGLQEGTDYEEIQELNFIERGNGFPPGNAILVDHNNQAAYRVLTYEETGDSGSIRTYGPGDGNEVTLYVEELDYEDHNEDNEAWDI